MGDWRMPFEGSEKLFPEDETPEDLCRGIQEVIDRVGVNTAVVEYASFQRMMGLASIAVEDEQKAINHLIESHAVLHRQQVNLRYTKTEIRQSCGHPQVYGVNPVNLKFDVDDREGPGSLRMKLRELPREWYMIQITQPYRCAQWTYDLTAVHPLHLTVLPTGPNAAEPFTVTLPKPDTSMYDLCKDMRNLLETNKADLQAEYTNHDKYWKMRAKQNNRMMTAVKEMEYTWLREWRILFIADSLEPSDLSEDLRMMVDKLIADDPSPIQVEPRSKWLLRKVATCSGYLSKREIARLVKYILPDRQKLAKNIILSINSKLQFAPEVQLEKRKTTILIVDEDIDYLPFEAMEILRKHPVTRFPSFHVVYAMFKEHEDTIEGGCKVMSINETSGIGIINPSRNLPKMEKRLRVFVDYWLPNWKTIYNAPPEEDAFVDALRQYPVLMYNGHGSGIQYLPGERIEKLRITSAVLLFGCSSVKLIPIGGRFPPYGVSNQYLTACSPCTLGMNWEVTDLDTDKMTTRFIAEWIPSSVDVHWKYVDLEKWGSGKLIFKMTPEKKSDHPFEPEMLRAVATSKTVCSQYMTSAAIVVRGLPVRVKWIS